MIYPSETFIITLDDEYDECDCKHECNCETIEETFEIKNEELVEHSEEEKEEIAQWMKIQEEAMDYYDMNKFENYVRWYVSMLQGTIEQPYILWDDNGDILTARSYYKAKENTMVEMKLLFDDSQLPQVKLFLDQIGFVFENLNHMFPQNTVCSMGSVHNPFQLLGKDKDMLYACNNFNAGNRRTSEMRLVFNLDQVEAVKKSLQTGGFML